MSGEYAGPRPGVLGSRRGCVRAASAVLALLAAAALAGCTGSPSVNSATNQGFVSSDGAITVLAADDRKDPGTVSGTTLDGTDVSLSDYRGKIVVVNVWGSWCPPCRAEAPILAAAARRLSDRGVEFLGIDTRDPGKTAPRVFNQQHGIDYPSIYDPSGRSLLAFHGVVPTVTIPSTVVIDRQGRVAASVIGELPSRTTLDDLVHDVVHGTRT